MEHLDMYTEIYRDYVYHVYPICTTSRTKHLKKLQPHLAGLNHSALQQGNSENRGHMTGSYDTNPNDALLQQKSLKITIYFQLFDTPHKWVPFYHPWKIPLKKKLQENIGKQILTNTLSDPFKERAI